jgi:DNA-directed RNA polymerase subunit L
LLNYKIIYYNQLTNQTTTNNMILSPPTLSNIVEKNNVLTFQMDNTPTSIVNGIRRTILTHIPVIAIVAFPYSKCQCYIEQNTTHLNNETLKSRLENIPIHSTDEFHLQNCENYELVLNETNQGEFDSIITTEHFKIRHKQTKEFIKNSESIFPPFIYNEKKYFIELLRLKAPIGIEIPGDTIQLTCDFSRACAQNNGAYCVVSKISCFKTIDTIKAEENLKLKILEWEKENKDIEFETKNYYLLDAKRFTQENSFQFVIETIGQYSNKQLLQMACDYLISKLNEIQTNTNHEFEIQPNYKQMQNSFLLTFHNYDHTCGKILEYMFYIHYYIQRNDLVFCSFEKNHPHDDFVTIIVSYHDTVDELMVIQHLHHCIEQATKMLQTIRNSF